MTVFELQTGVCAICPIQTYHWGVKSEGGWRRAGWSLLVCEQKPLSYSSL